MNVQKIHLKIIKFIKSDYTALVFGALIISAWTMYRFFTKTIIFDMVGQQVLAAQWLDGYTGGSITAPTNYLIKIFSIYMPAQLLNLPPLGTLIVMTVVINIATWVGIYFVIKRILLFFNINYRRRYNLLMLWLATISVSVFWIQFINSRNIEVVLGLWTIYFILRSAEKPSTKLSIWLVILAGITFFADPMQLYISAIIAVIFLCVSIVRKSDRFKTRHVFNTFVLVAAAYFLSWTAVYWVKSIYGIEFFNVNNLHQSIGILTHPVETMKGTARSIVRLLSGTNEIWAFRQYLNIGVLVLATVFYVKSFFSYKDNREFKIFSAIFIAVPILVYMASGYAASNDDTSRYLIMLAPAVILAFAGMEMPRLATKGLNIILAIIVLFSAGLLFYSTAMNVRFIGDKDIISRQQYLSQNQYIYGYSSMDTAMPAAYIVHDDHNLLPLNCVDGKLYKTKVFYDAAKYKHVELQAASTVPLIFDRNTISNHPFMCGEDQVRSQLGNPFAIKQTQAGDTVYLYKKTDLEVLTYL